jgi:hypothetical protein
MFDCQENCVEIEYRNQITVVKVLTDYVGIVLENGGKTDS